MASFNQHDMREIRSSLFEERDPFEALADGRFFFRLIHAHQEVSEIAYYKVNFLVLPHRKER